MEVYLGKAPRVLLNIPVIAHRRSFKSLFNITFYRSFSLSRNKKINWKPSSGRSQQMKYYKRLIYKQFAQVSGLCGPLFLSYLPKRFTHLCRALYGDATLVHRFGPPIYGRRKSTKHLKFTFPIKALSFHSRTSIRAHKHIF